MFLAEPPIFKTVKRFLIVVTYLNKHGRVLQHVTALSYLYASLEAFHVASKQLDYV